ncbi:hypothetical protein DPMN_018371 [Dreissena polymorpha]|uniref:Uncharacterized protein n=1 Tax=Dreissena polymorpha TaxID=45954 RepID=A0A9D4NEZ9_DREPO|nr:hypothetical protein DPMN_018371 [Dreissena polymorpha]
MTVLAGLTEPHAEVPLSDPPRSDDEVKPLFNLRKFTIPLGDSSEKFSRKSSAGDSPRPVRDVHAPAAYRAI